MTDAEFKKAISEALCDEYIESIPEHDVHAFSNGYRKKMDKLVKRRKKSYYLLVNTAFKRSAVTAAAVLFLLLMPLSVKAVRKEAYDFIIRIFPDHSELSIDKTDNSYPKTINKEYTIPELEEEWEMNVWRNDSQAIAKDFVNGDDYVLFYQCTMDHYVVEYENDNVDMEKYVDEYGEDYLIGGTDDSVSLVWNNGEYVFLLSGSLNKEEALELCRTLKTKENSELVSQSE